jgi:hypothetical protein
MDARLEVLIKNYLSAIAEAVRLLTDSGVVLTANFFGIEERYRKRGTLKSGLRYFPHGTGCLVELPSGGIDFDFGVKGETNRFDPSKLKGFAGKRLLDYGFSNIDEYFEAFAQAVEDGEIVKVPFNIYCLKIDS